MSGVALLSVTFPDATTAERIGRAVVEERFAACVNLTPCRSFYRWAGAVKTADEMAATFKTSAALAPALAARIVELHPYDLPAVDWTPAAATDATLGWVLDAVGR